MAALTLRNHHTYWLQSMTQQNHGKPGNTGITRIIKATGYSIQGLKAAFKHEAAIRQEVALLVIAIALVTYLDVSMLERITMLGTVVLVLIYRAGQFCNRGGS